MQIMLHRSKTDADMYLCFINNFNTFKEFNFFLFKIINYELQRTLKTKISLMLIEEKNSRLEQVFNPRLQLYGLARFRLCQPDKLLGKARTFLLVDPQDPSDRMSGDYPRENFWHGPSDSSGRRSRKRANA